MIVATYFSGMYLGGDKIGYVIVEINPTEYGYILKETMLMRLSMMGQERTTETSSLYHLDDSYRLKRFSFELKSDGQSISSIGEVRNGRLEYSIETGGVKRDAVIELDRDVHPAQAIPFIVSSERRDLSLLLFDPTIFATNRAEVRILEDKGDSIKYQTELLGTRAVTWVGQNGEVLRSEEPMGIIVVRQEKEEVLRFGDVSPEIITMFAVDPGMEIANPREVTYLKAIVRGRFMETERQKLFGDTLIVESIEPDQEKIPRVKRGFGCVRVEPSPVPQELRKYLESTPLIQVDDRRIRNKAARITRGARDNWEKVGRLIDWVYQNVEDSPTATIPSALDVLETLRGDCNEHAVLFAALARAAGIPTEISVGLVLMKGKFYYHAWNKVWVGSWVEVDPTFNQKVADATHITLAEGGIQEWAKIMDLIGNIEIRVIRSSYR